MKKLLSICAALLLITAVSVAALGATPPATAPTGLTLSNDTLNTVAGGATADFEVDYAKETLKITSVNGDYRYAISKTPLISASLVNKGAAWSKNVNIPADSYLKPDSLQTKDGDKLEISAKTQAAVRAKYAALKWADTLGTQMEVDIAKSIGKAPATNDTFDKFVYGYVYAQYKGGQNEWIQIYDPVAIIFPRAPIAKGAVEGVAGTTNLKLTENTSHYEYVMAGTKDPYVEIDEATSGNTNVLNTLLLKDVTNTASLNVRVKAKFDNTNATTKVALTTRAASTPISVKVAVMASPKVSFDPATNSIKGASEKLEYYAFDSGNPGAKLGTGTIAANGWFPGAKKIVVPAGADTLLIRTKADTKSAPSGIVLVETPKPVDLATLSVVEDNTNPFWVSGTTGGGNLVMLKPIVDPVGGTLRLSAAPAQGTANDAQALNLLNNLEILSVADPAADAARDLKWTALKSAYYVKAADKIMSAYANAATDTVAVAGEFITGIADTKLAAVKIALPKATDTAQKLWVRIKADAEKPASLPIQITNAQITTSANTVFKVTTTYGDTSDAYVSNFATWAPAVTDKYGAIAQASTYASSNPTGAKDKPYPYEISTLIRIPATAGPEIAFDFSSANATGITDFAKFSAVAKASKEGVDPGKAVVLKSKDVKVTVKKDLTVIDLAVTFPGRTTVTYYRVTVKDEAGAKIDAVKGITGIEVAATYATTQANAGNQTDAKGIVETALKAKINNASSLTHTNGVVVSVVEDTFTAAVTGTSDGTYKFKIKYTLGSYSETSAEITAVITKTA